MPASLPGATTAENLANPSQGKFVTFDPLSGPKGTPFDARKITGWSGGNPTYAADATNLSTGGLNTGIGFGVFPFRTGSVAPNFTDDAVPGYTDPKGTASAFLLYIGGGRSTATGAPNPYTTTALAICGAGNGGSRDGAGPAGFALRIVTTAGSVANGAAIETGWVNRTGTTLPIGYSGHGSGSAALAVPTVAASESEDAQATADASPDEEPPTKKHRK